MGKGRKILNFFHTYAKDKSRNHNQHTADISRVRKCIGNGYRDKILTLSYSHFYMRRTAAPFSAASQDTEKLQSKSSAAI